jgi:hypothetical protein
VNSWTHNPEGEGDISPAREVAIPYKYLKIFGLATEDITVKTLVFESNGTELKFIRTDVRAKLFPSEVLQLVYPDFTELPISPVHAQLYWFKASEN